MSTWLFEGALSIALFLVLIPLLIAPFLRVVYRRYRYPAPGPTALAAATGLYACALVAFTTFPLPEPDADFCTRRELYDYWRLQPGQSFAELWHQVQQTGFPAVLTGNDFLQIAFNVVFFLPLGFLVAYRLRRGPAAAALAGLAVSLLIETTQGSGLWFLYPCPYRVAEFDDLITNTSGAVLGWVVGWLVSRRWPFVEPEPRNDPGPPTMRRRVMAAALDLTVVSIITLLIDVAVTLVEEARGTWTADSVWFTLVQYAAGAGLLLVLPMLHHCRSTPGQDTVLLGQQRRSIGGQPAPPGAVVARFAVRWLPILVFGTPALAAVAVVELATVALRKDRRSLANVVARTETVTWESLQRDDPGEGHHRPTTGARL